MQISRVLKSERSALKDVLAAARRAVDDLKAENAKLAAEIAESQKLMEETMRDLNVAKSENMTLADRVKQLVSEYERSSREVAASHTPSLVDCRVA